MFEILCDAVNNVFTVPKFIMITFAQDIFSCLMIAGQTSDTNVD